MTRPHYAQRQHLVHAFDHLLYQLHTLSFFLSPSVWGFVFRIASQFRCQKPKDIDLAHTLRFYCMVIFALNLPNIFMHIAYGAADGRAVILDFVGMSYTPSRLQLLSLDSTIIILQLVLITISYETAAANLPESTEDILLPPIIPSSPLPSGLPTPITSRAPSPTSSSSQSRRRQRQSRSSIYDDDDNESTSSMYPTNSKPTGRPNAFNHPADIVHLRLQPVLSHLRTPPPPPMSLRHAGSLDSASLPMPNTTPMRLPSSLRMLVRTQVALATRSTADVMNGGQLPLPQPRSSSRSATVNATAREPRAPPDVDVAGGRSENRFPGAMDTD